MFSLGHWRKKQPELNGEEEEAIKVLSRNRFRDGINGPSPGNGQGLKKTDIFKIQILLNEATIKVDPTQGLEIAINFQMTLSCSLTN